MSELLECSTRLIERVEQMKQLFPQYIDKEPDFYHDVKPFVDTLRVDADKWRDLALDWVKHERPLYIHSINIEDTHENLIHTSLQTFYHDVKEKRYKEMTESIMYTIGMVTSQLSS
ncbi:DUF1798 family protein [Bacillus solimangrovi]|uniref:DUF1798 domain-containing protein n=1 Tax=Bacillus solimangrovi TaxID=1305675 RepID=A0A1E5LFZ6_9BACI|nr:DUF1798 family protein [Bacillus solimangrovi]OEH92992.1 hypothetical protein BFG57_14105 [Bacillus solimangrovi]